MPDMFSYLIFIQGLTAPPEKEVSSRLLIELEQDEKIILKAYLKNASVI